MTAQVNDKLIYNGQEFNLAVEPLYQYLKKKKIKFIAPDTACWRGYHGSWTIENDKLYLTELTAYVRKHKDKSPYFDRIEVGLEYLFPNQEKVFADWFSGELRIPYGEMIRYVHQGYASIYEKELFIKIKSGRIVSSKEIDNTHIYGNEEALKEKELDGIIEYVLGKRLKKKKSWYNRIIDKFRSIFN